MFIRLLQVNSTQPLFCCWEQSPCNNAAFCIQDTCFNLQTVCHRLWCENRNRVRILFRMLTATMAVCTTFVLTRCELLIGSSLKATLFNYMQLIVTLIHSLISRICSAMMCLYLKDTQVDPTELMELIKVFWGNVFYKPVPELYF